MEEHQSVIESLRTLGKAPVDPVTANRHLSRMVDVRARTPLTTKVKVGAAFGIGFLAGSAGLASAGALPGPAQSVAHTVLSSVGVHVPGGPQRYNGPECGGTYKNHGQYVRAHTQDPNAGQSRCGKPIQAGTGSDSTNAPATPGNPSTTAPGNSAATGHGNPSTTAPGNPSTTAPGHSGTRGHGNPSTTGPGNSGSTGNGNPSTTAPGNPSTTAPSNGHGNTKSHGHAGNGGNNQSGASGNPVPTTPTSTPTGLTPTTSDSSGHSSGHSQPAGRVARS